MKALKNNPLERMISTDKETQLPGQKNIEDYPEVLPEEMKREKEQKSKAGRKRKGDIVRRYKGNIYYEVRPGGTLKRYCIHGKKNAKRSYGRNGGAFYPGKRNRVPGRRERDPKKIGGGIYGKMQIVRTFCGV